MNSAIDRLSEIEATAVQYIESAHIEKRALERKSKAALQKYDAQIDAQTSKELQALNKRLHKKMQAELEKLEDRTNRTITFIQADYNTNHTKIAKKILHQFIEG